MGWLALELKPDETVHLGPSTRVCLVRIRGNNSATVAIAAPPDVRIYRDEVLQRHPHLIETLGKPQPFAGLADLICRTTVAIAAPPDVRIYRDEVLQRHPHLIETLGKPQPFAGLADLICRTIDAIPTADDRLDHAADARRVLRQLLAEVAASDRLTAINATLATPPAPTNTQATP